MGWYKNQKARHAAKKAGQPRPRTGGVGDKISDKLGEIAETSQAKADDLRAWREEHGDSAESYLAWRETRKGEKSDT